MVGSSWRPRECCSTMRYIDDFDLHCRLHGPWRWAARALKLHARLYVSTGKAVHRRSCGGSAGWFLFSCAKSSLLRGCENKASCIENLCTYNAVFIVAGRNYTAVSTYEEHPSQSRFPESHLMPGDSCQGRCTRCTKHVESNVVLIDSIIWGLFYLVYTNLAWKEVGRQESHVVHVTCRLGPGRCSGS